jgi:hypothetical protein
MKYPAHTISTPVLGKQAKRILNAISSGKEITNPEREKTIRLIAAARKSRMNTVRSKAKIQND